MSYWARQHDVRSHLPVHDSQCSSRVGRRQAAAWRSPVPQEHTYTQVVGMMNELRRHGQRALRLVLADVEHGQGLAGAGGRVHGCGGGRSDAGEQVSKGHGDMRHEDRDEVLYFQLGARGLGRSLSVYMFTWRGKCELRAGWV